MDGNLKTFLDQKWRRVIPFLVFPLALLWMELLIKLWDFGSIWNRGLLYTSLFTLAFGFSLTALCTSGPRHMNRILSLLVMAGMTLLYMAQAVYFTVTKTVFAVYSMSVATNATEFWRVGVLGVGRSLPILILMALPLVLLFLFGKQHTPDRIISWRRVGAWLLLALILHGVGILSVVLSTGGILSPWEIYRSNSNPNLSLSNFGVLTSLRLDLRHALFPTKPEHDLPTPEPDEPNPLPETTKYAPNILDIDFEGLVTTETDSELRDMHSYFNQEQASLQNEYTGKFAGKNLIMLTAEAFSSWAVHPELTPTLYKLANEGFRFKNFYTPLWWVSTSDGEYFSCTSLIPKSGKQSFGLSARNHLPFCMGNQLKGDGYDTRAYHNHTYTYYNRDITHPNMGYTYKGIGNGLDVKKTWPESDLEMMENSLPEYINNAPFHAYYMTVSGHLEYNFIGNQMAYKHRNEVSHLPLSEEAQAYLACQIELDRALEHLLAELEAAGQLRNTVICLYADHYPYGLAPDTIEELAGEDLSDSLELYRNTMILWSGDMTDPVDIEKPCSNLDIVPTLSNLFGLEFDSRLLMGRDILSTDPGLVMFADNSYITELGTYYAKDDHFIPKEGAVIPEDYAKGILQRVQEKFFYSGKILLRDYYGLPGLGLK